jgi:hypothetical protein
LGNFPKMRLLLLGSSSSDFLCERWFVGIERVIKERRDGGFPTSRLSGLSENILEICASSSISSLRTTLSNHRLDASLTDPEAILASIRSISSLGPVDFDEADYSALVNRIISRFHSSEPLTDYFMDMTDSHWLLVNQRSNLVQPEGEFRNQFLKNVAIHCRPSSSALDTSLSTSCASAVKRYLATTLPSTISLLEQELMTKLGHPTLGQQPAPYLLRIMKRTRLAYKTALEHVEELWLHASRAGCTEEEIAVIFGTRKAESAWTTSAAIGKALQIVKYDNEFDKEESFRKGLEYLHLVHDRNFAALPMWPGSTGSVCPSREFQQLHLRITDSREDYFVQSGDESGGRRLMKSHQADLHTYRKMLMTYVDSMASFVAVRTVGNFIQAFTRVDVFLDRLGLPYAPAPAERSTEPIALEHPRGYLLFYLHMTRPLAGRGEAAEVRLRYGAFKEGSRLSGFFRRFARPELMDTLYKARYSEQFKNAVAADALAHGIRVEHLLTTLIPGRPGTEDPKALYDMYAIASDRAKAARAVQHSKSIPMIRAWIDELVDVATRNAHYHQVLYLWKSAVLQDTPALIHGKSQCPTIAKCKKFAKLFLVHAGTQVQSASSSSPAGLAFAELEHLIQNSLVDEREIRKFVADKFTLLGTRPLEFVDSQTLLDKLNFPSCEAILDFVLAPAAGGQEAAAVWDYVEFRDARYSDFLESVAIPAFQALAADVFGDEGGVEWVCRRNLVGWLWSGEFSDGGREVLRALQLGYVVEKDELRAAVRPEAGSRGTGVTGVTGRRALEIFEQVQEYEISQALRQEVPYAAAYFVGKDSRWEMVRKYELGGLKHLLGLSNSLVGAEKGVKGVIESALKTANIRKRHEFWIFVLTCLHPEITDTSIFMKQPQIVNKYISKIQRKFLRDQLINYRGQVSLGDFVLQLSKNLPQPEEGGFDFSQYIDQDALDGRAHHDELLSRRQAHSDLASDDEYANSLHMDPPATLSIFESLYMWLLTIVAASMLRINQFITGD